MSLDEEARRAVREFGRRLTEEFWITRNLMTGELRFWRHRKDATDHAVEENKKDTEHPSFSLWSGKLGEKLTAEGRLLRRYGTSEMYWDKDEK